MVAKPLCPLYKNIIKPLDRARYPELRFNYKLSQTNRGSAQFYYVKEDGTEVALGQPVNQSTSGSERMVTIDLGTYKIEKAGKLRIKMKLVDGGISGSGKYIGGNYIIFTKQ